MNLRDFHQEKQVSDFQAKCRLKALFPEKESQDRRQADRIKLSCYFPDIERKQDRLTINSFDIIDLSLRCS